MLTREERDKDIHHHIHARTHTRTHAQRNAGWRAKSGDHVLLLSSLVNFVRNAFFEGAVLAGVSGVANIRARADLNGVDAGFFRGVLGSTLVAFTRDQYK